MKRYWGYVDVSFNNILAEDDRKLQEIIEDQCGSDLKIGKIEIVSEEEVGYLMPFEDSIYDR